MHLRREVESERRRADEAQSVLAKEQAYHETFVRELSDKMAAD